MPESLTDLALDRLLPLKPADFQVLMVLSDGPMHAYGISKAVEDQLKGRVRLEIGSLYRMMGRLMANGLIEDIGDGSEGLSPRDRRRSYRITEFGRQVAQAEARRLRDVLEVARSKNLIAESKSL